MNMTSSLFPFLKSGHRIFIHGQAATSASLIEKLVEHVKAQQLTNLELMHLHTQGPAPYALPENQKHFKVANLFVGANVRPYMNFNTVDYIPCFLSEMPHLIRSNIRPIDVALIQVSPPDEHGYCSLGTSVDTTKAAVDTAKHIVAHINPQMPRTFGDGIIHQSKFTTSFTLDTPIQESKPRAPTEVELQIGKLTAPLIEDGSTLQMGIGSIPDAVLYQLKNHQHLGIHSEMWSDGALELIQSGVVDNSKKKAHPGKTVCTFVVGSKKVYSFIHNNPSIAILEASYVNQPAVIAKNPKVVAINSAVEVDLTGQVCADSIGSKIISGVGGQIDFINGAAMSKDGKSIIAMTSRSPKGASRLVSKLQQGAGVVTTRAHVHYIITEYGVANLYGKTIGERAKMLINIAHPDDREALDREWYGILRGHL